MSCNCTDDYNKCLGSWYAYASWTNTKIIMNELKNLDLTSINEQLNEITESITTLTENQETCCAKTIRKLNRIIKLINNSSSIIENWGAGIDYEISDEVMYNDIKYNCIQSHISQNDWTPDVCPALWGKDFASSLNEVVEDVSVLSVSENMSACVIDEVEVEEYVVNKKGKIKKVNKK